MDNTQSVFDAKVTIHGTLHTLISIKELLGQSVNERRRRRFSSTVFGKWLDFLAYSNDNLLPNYIFQHEVKQEQNNDVCPPLSPFCDRVFPDKIAEPLKKVRVSELLELIRKPERWSLLSDEDSVKVCLLLVSNIVFMGRESKNYIADNLIELVDDLTAWDAYPWGEYFWRALYRRYILEMYRNNKFWWKKDLLVIPRGLSWSKIIILRNGILVLYFLNDGQPNGPITTSPQGIQLIIESVPVFTIKVHDPQFESQAKQAVESVPVFTSEDLVAEYHSITTSVQLLENVGDGDPSILLKEIAAVKQRMTAIERFIKSRNDNLSEDSVAKQSVEKEIEYSDGKPDSAISNVFIGETSCQNLVQEQLESRDMCIHSIGNQFVQRPLESPKGKRPESSISDVLNGDLSVVETSKNEALSEEFDPKEYNKNVDESGDGNVTFASESEIINVLTGQVSCDKYVGGFYECESSKLYHTDPKEYPSSSMTQLLQATVPEQTSSQMLAYTPVDLNLPNLNESFTESQVNEYAEFDFDNTDNDSLSDMVKTGPEEIHLDGLETVDDPFVQTPDNQNSEEMSMYVNEVDVVNQNEPPSSEKVVGQLMRKRKARMLQIKNTRISFDDDDDPDFKVHSLEEWESIKLKNKRNKKEPIRQSQIALKEIPLVEFHEDLSRAPYNRRTKVKFPECIDMVYALGDETSYIFPWGNLLGLKEGDWLSDRHLDAWFELMWSFRPTYADWAIGSSYFCGFVMRGDIPGWICNEVRYPVMWADVEQVFFSINEPNKHYSLDVLHFRTGVITLYDSLYSKAVERRKWWIKMRKAFKKYIPPYLQEWGILDAKGIPLESYNINFVGGKDVPIQGDAYGDCGVWVTLVCQSSKRQVILPKDIDYHGLLAYVQKKFDIISIHDFILYYKCGLEVFEVKDEDDVQFFVNEVCGQSEIVQKLCVKKIKEHKQVKVVVPPVNDFDLNVSLFTNDYNDQTENLPKWQVNTFTHMPISPPPPPPYIEKSRVEYHGISVGDDFPNKNECIYTIGVKSLRESFQYAVIKSCSKRDIHTCSKTQINPNHRNATMKLLGNILVDKMRESNRVYKIKDIQHDMRVDWKIDISYKRAWGGRNMALHIINGSHVDSFSRLSYYCYNLKLENEGTVTHIHTDADGRFEMLYVGFRFAIRSFLRYMRPLVIIDGVHLKVNYLGTNILDVGMDGNNQIIPLATDRHTTIIQACGRVFDNSFHGFCDRHLMMNCNLKGKKLRGIFWKACKAYTTEDFDKAISELRGHRPEVVRKLKEVELINSLTRIVRRVPITMLIEYCRDLLQRWYCEKRQKYEEAPANELGDWAAAKVYDKMLKSASWTVRTIDHLKLFQVFNKLEVHQPNQRRNSVRTNSSLLDTTTREEHLSEEARLDEERLRNGRVYMDWNDVQASEEPVTTTEGMAVEDSQAVQGRLHSYNPYINFLS
ncbi:transposase, MuDR, MULE transposase domain protein [Tanacetum coccineum]